LCVPAFDDLAGRLRMLLIIRALQKSATIRIFPLTFPSYLLKWHSENGNAKKGFPAASRGIDALDGDGSAGAPPCLARFGRATLLRSQTMCAIMSHYVSICNPLRFLEVGQNVPVESRLFTIHHSQFAIFFTRHAA
jgi:hypothetical protein